MKLGSKKGFSIPLIHLFFLFIILCFVSAFLLTFNFADFSITWVDYLVLSLSFLLFIPFTAIVAFPLWKGRKFFDNMKKADENELQREDDIFLKAVTFSQSTLFIYLNLISISSSFLLFFKWLIPVIATLFFIMRGYAKIKCNPKYRYWSTILGIFIPLVNSYFFVPMFVFDIKVAGFPVVLVLWLISSYIVSLFVASSVSGGFKARYGYDN